MLAPVRAPPVSEARSPILATGPTARSSRNYSGAPPDVQESSSAPPSTDRPASQRF